MCTDCEIEFTCLFDVPVANTKWSASDVFFDISISENLSSRWVTPPQKIDMEGMSRLANHPFSVPGLSDRGALA